ncbi:MAG: dethiobiotin synthase [Thermodesulfobacteriota bacterium]
MKRGGFPDRLFVTGTDTGVGKTVVCAVLMAGLQGVYWKPVQSGAKDGTDTAFVRRVTGLDGTHFRPEAYVLSTPVSPHLAAQLEGRKIELEKIVVPPVDPDTTLIIEGAGGLMVPLDDRHLMLDLIRRIGAPVLVVAQSRLGMINHTLLTVNRLEQAGVPVFGVAVNGRPNAENRKAVEHYGHVAVVAEIPPMPAITPAALKACFERFAW